MNRFTDNEELLAAAAKLPGIHNPEVVERLTASDLTEEEKDYYSWVFEREDAEDFTFFRFSGWTYCEQDFIRTSLDEGFWDGGLGTTAFSSVVVRLISEDELLAAHWYGLSS